MKRGIRAAVMAASVGGIVGLALAMPALADDADLGQRCRAVRHGTDEFTVCVYRDGSDFNSLPILAPEAAIAAFNAFLAAPADVVCVKRAAVRELFVQCYFSRDIFEADPGNPAWDTLGPEVDVPGAALYSLDELTPRESGDPTPQDPPGAIPAEPRLPSSDVTPDSSADPSTE
jgi:hypothetical protein